MTNEKDKEFEKKCKEFDERHEKLLNELKGMERNSAEEREARFHWIKAQPEYSQFIADIMNTTRNNYYNKLARRLAGEVDDSINADAGIATMDSRTTDEVVFFETLKEMIETYTGEERDKNGDKVTFAKRMNKSYKQKAQQAAGQNDINKRRGGIRSGTPKRDQHYIIRFVKEVKRLEASQGSLKTIEEIMEEVKAKIPHKFTKAELETAIDLVNRLELASADQEVNEDNKATIQDLLEDPRQYAQVDNMFDIEFWKMLGDHFVDKWNKVVDATTKVNREILKAFFSKDLLIALKLEALNEAMRKEYEAFLEPKCGQWCHRRNRCLYSRKNGCYIRYGMREECKQNGDDEIYDILKTIEELYEAILDNDYVRYAYSEHIKGLQDIYEKPLKPFKGDEKGDTFLFTDAILGEALGEKKGKISKQRAKYEGEARESLFKIFKADDVGSR